ncbi:MAG: hypothetical protein WBZ20_07610 [Nitrososphaeraceae archaeon]
MAEDNSRSSTGRGYADDKIPPIGDIRMISEYPDRRIKAIVCTITSTGTVTSSQGLDLAALLTVAFG